MKAVWNSWLVRLPRTIGAAACLPTLLFLRPAECQEHVGQATARPAVDEIQRSTGRTSLEFRISSLLSLHYWIWDLALSDDTGAVPPELADAVHVARRFKPSNVADWDSYQRSLGFDLAKIVLSLDCGRSIDAIGEDLADRSHFPQGRLRKFGKEYLRALREAQSDYVACYWPMHRALVVGNAQHLEDSLAGSQGKLISYLTGRMGIADPGGTIPVYWLWHAPGILGLTLRLEEQGPMCLIDLADAPGLVAYEVVAHEVLHALDKNSIQHSETLFNRLRRSLRDTEGTRIDLLIDPFAEQMVHMVLGVEAKEAVRRVYESTYEPRSDPFDQLWDEGPPGLSTEEWHSYLIALTVGRDAWRSHLMASTSESDAIEILKHLRSEGTLEIAVERTDVEQAKSDVMTITFALVRYSINNRLTDPEGLDELVVPDEKGITYLEAVPLDPWGNEYGYEPPVPGTFRPRVFCYGADGKPGGEGEDADFDNFMIEAGDE